MIRELGIPYMGSKRKLALNIINAITKDNPNAKYFWDLFGGGGAVSFTALQFRQFEKVYYNDLNTGVCNLLKKIRDEGVTPEFYEWIDRTTFHQLVKGDDWKAGLVKTCWSFGNGQKSYIYGADIENLKREATEYLMSNGYDGSMTTRVRLLKEFKAKANFTKRFDLQQLEQLQQLQQLEIYNQDYTNITITTPPEETVIYLDPPYQNTGKYQCVVNYNELYSYFHNSQYKIYLSSYEFDAEEVCSYEHRSTLSPTNNSKKVQEKLYCNKPSDNNLQTTQFTLLDVIENIR